MANCYASKLVSIAKSQIGVKETPNNITKYSKDFDEKYPDFYNTKKQGAEWCDIFYDWCMVTAFGVTDALRLLCQPKKSCGAGTVFSYGYYKAKKQVGKVPRIGAQIFFTKDGTEKGIHHTGMVVKVDSSKVYTIEGNADNKVGEHSYSINSKKIYGYGYPAFDEEPVKADDPKKETAAPEPPKKPTYEGSVIVYTVVKGDTLTKIAKNYGLSVKQICEWNPDIKDPNKIYVGQKIKLGSNGSKENKPVPATERYKVTAQRGLYIRKTPVKDLTGLNIVTALAHGAVVDIAEISNNWARLADGRGYCCMKENGNTYLERV